MDPNIDFWGGGIVKGRGKFDIPLAGGAVFIHRGLQEGFKPRGWVDIIDYFLLKTLLLSLSLSLCSMLFVRLFILGNPLILLILRQSRSAVWIYKEVFL